MELEREEEQKRQVKIATTKETGGYKKLCGQSNSWDSRKRGYNVFREELFAMYFLKARKLTVQR